jgi:3-deoxy-D-manno-octulosonic-acid transferase
MGNSLSLAAYTALRRGQKSDVAPEATARPSGPLIWAHAPDRNHLRALVCLALHMRDLDERLTFLLTCDTAPLPSQPGVIIRKTPPDTIADARAFLSHWAPNLLIWSHGHLHPTLLSETDANAMPRFLISANTDGFEMGTSLWSGRITRALLGRFDRILASDEKTAKHLKTLGANPWAIERSSPLQEGAMILSCNEAERADVAQVFAGRPVWLAASAHLSEAAILSDAHCKASRFSHRLMLVICPANPNEGEEFAALMAQLGRSTATRSLGEEPEESTEVYIADLEGEFGLWYRVAPITYMGGTLSGIEGRSPFEPAALGSAILHGPRLHSFRDAYARHDQAGAARIIANADQLAPAIETLLSPDKSAQLAHSAWDVTSSSAMITDRVAQLINEALT